MAWRRYGRLISRVALGTGEADARDINAGFLTRLAKGRPMVALKLATTLDGRIALADGASRWITGPEARQRAHLLRATYDAILVGTGTVAADDPPAYLPARRPGGPLASPHCPRPGPAAAAGRAGIRWCSANLAGPWPWRGGGRAPMPCGERASNSWKSPLAPTDKLDLAGLVRQAGRTGPHAGAGGERRQIRGGAVSCRPGRPALLVSRRRHHRQRRPGGDRRSWACKTLIA